MKTLRIDDVERIPVFGTLVWKPIRRQLGVTAFGINAYSAARDHSALHYWLARVEALAGNEQRAREELTRCTPQHREAFAKLGLLPAG